MTLNEYFANIYKKAQDMAHIPSRMTGLKNTNEEGEVKMAE